MIRYFSNHPTIANLLMIGFIAVGLVMVPSLQRETFPRIAPNKLQITVVYPGATPETVEEAICQRLEDAIDGVDGLHETTCDAREGRAIATVEMEEGQNLDRFTANVRTEVEAINDFPENTETPIIKQLGRTDFVASLAITGPMSRPDLKLYAEQVKDRMKAFGGIPIIEVKGFSDEQIRIEIADGVLRQYGLSFQDIARTVERQSVDLPAGTITTRDQEILLRFTGERRTVPEVESIVVVTDADGGQIRLGDIAKVTDRFEADEIKTLFNGRPAAILDIVKSASDDIIRVADRLREFVERERQQSPPSVTYDIIRDGSTIVQERLTLLLENGLMGLALVALATWAVFGTRYAFWIAMGLPVAFLGGIATMALIGYSINMMTMVALLIVVGILMDDAIVISENIASKSEQGLPPLEAAAEGAKQVLPGVLSSFLTTFCIFGSLAFLEGNIGQVLSVIPVVMIAVLACSLVEAFLILPHHLGHSLAGATGQPGPVQRWSARAIDWSRERIGDVAFVCVRLRFFTLGCAAASLIVAISILAAGIVKFSPFPSLDGDTLEARILLPQGTPLARTEAVVARIERAALKLNEELTPQQPGQQPLIKARSIRFNENADAFESGPHVATISIDLLPSETRTIDNDTFFARWRDAVGTIPDVISLQFIEPSIGPAGRAIDIRLIGSDLNALKAASLDLQKWLNRYAGVVDLMDDLRLGKPEFRIALRPEGLALDLRSEDVAQQIRAAYFGTTVDEVQTSEKEFEIEVRLAAVDRSDLSILDRFVITTSAGGQVPLTAIADVTLERGYARINRVDGVRTVTIIGNVDPRVGNATEIIADTKQRFLPGFLERHPGVRLSIGGEQDEAATAQRSMISGFLLGLIGVFMVLSFQFRSYVEPIVVMVLIPFAFVGVVLGHLVMGLEFTMPSLLGLAALSGIIVNDSILLVNQIKSRHRAGLTVAEIAPDAVRARYRAILLTSVTTIAGLLPLLSETSLQAQIMIPLVTSLAFGLMASTTLVLIVVPAFYAILDDFGFSTLADDDDEVAATGHSDATSSIT